MKTVVALVVAVCGILSAGCGGRVGVDQPWSRPAPIVPGPGAGGSGGSGGDTGGGAGEGGAGGAGEECPEGCDDGNDCTADVCVGGVCQYLGASAPDECATAQQNTGVCAWSSCILTDCGQSDHTDWEPCFFEGGVGVCSDGECIAPCEVDADCEDGNVCTVDYCMGNGACWHAEDTLHLACGEGADAGHCWEGACCAGCFDLLTGECGAACPEGKTCSANGACL